MSVYRVSVADTPQLVGKVTVSLDGRQVEMCCIGADPVEGWVDVVESLYTNPDGPYDPAVKRMYGCVQIKAVE